MNQCPICERPIPSGMFMCRDHWFMLPQTLRSAIWSIYSDWQAGQADGVELTKLHEQAIAIVNKKTQRFLFEYRSQQLCVVCHDRKQGLLSKFGYSQSDDPKEITLMVDMLNSAARMPEYQDRLESFFGLDDQG